jgi:predicted secreted protein
VTPTEQAVIDAARAVEAAQLAWDAAEAMPYSPETFHERTMRCDEWLTARHVLNAALAALDSEPDYRERMARLFRGEDK